LRRRSSVSSPLFLHIDEIEGTNAFIKTKTFVNYTTDHNIHIPRQKVMPGNSDRSDLQRQCVVFNEDITPEGGGGYVFGGFNKRWEDGEEIHLKLAQDAWIRKIYDPNDE
jgi:hypothetical protein